MRLSGGGCLRYGCCCRGRAQRLCLRLNACRCFLEQCGTRKPGYADWVENQKELAHLLEHLTLDA